MKKPAGWAKPQAKTFVDMNEKLKALCHKPWAEMDVNERNGVLKKLPLPGKECYSQFHKATRCEKSHVPEFFQKDFLSMH